MTNPHDLKFVQYDDADRPLSCHVVGLKLDNSGGVFIQSVRPDLDHTAFSVQATFRYMCACEDAEWVGIIYCGRKPDGTLTYVRMYRNDPPPPQEDEAMHGALLRIAISRDGFIRERDGAERAIEGMQFLARELGIK